VHRVHEELLLVFVFLSNVWIYIAILRFLVLDKTKQALVDCNFKLLMIVSVLHYLVDSIFKFVDIGVVLADFVTVLGYHLCD